MRRFAVAAVVVFLLAWSASFLAVVLASRRDAAAPADAIVVLGAAQYNGHPSPVLRARLEHARSLYARGLAPLVIVTGGVGERDTVSEAAVGQRYLRARGLPDSAVLAEDAGNSTEPSVRAATRVIAARGGVRAILVSDGFHQLRLAIIARRLGLVPLGSPARTSPIRASRRRELGYLLAESFKAPAAFLLTRSE